MMKKRLKAGCKVKKEKNRNKPTKREKVGYVRKRTR
jgi:hypothetical protein